MVALFFYEMGNLVSKYQFGVNFTRDYDVRWVHISLFGRLTAACPQSFEEINMRWHLKRHGSLARHQFIIVDSSYWPQWRLHLSSHGCTRMRHSYDVGVLSFCGVIPDLWAGTRENYIKLKYAVDGLPMGWWWIPASTNADTCDQKPSGAHIGDHTRKLLKIQAALSELRLVQHLIISWLKGWWSFTILCGYIFRICGFRVKTDMPYGQTSQSVTGNMPFITVPSHERQRTHAVTFRGLYYFSTVC